MALTRTDCIAAASGMLFLGLLGGESALVVAQRSFESNPPKQCDGAAPFEDGIANAASLPCDVPLAPYPKLVDYENTRELRLKSRDENPFIDSGAHQAYLARVRTALHARLGAGQEAAAPLTDTEMEYR